MPMPLSTIRAPAVIPSLVSGTFTITLSAMAVQVAGLGQHLLDGRAQTTSAETGPGVISQIRAMRSANSRPSLAARVGLVVTPSRRPQLAGGTDVGQVRCIQEQLHGTSRRAGHPSRAMHAREVGAGDWERRVGNPDSRL